MRALFLLTLFLVLSACGKGGPKSNPETPSNFVPSDWSPEHIELSCNVKDGCPEQVGLLIFTFPEQGNRVRYRKCTAFLSAENQITSNGHCDHADTIGAQGYFVATGKISRKITRRIFKLYTPGASANEESERPDVAIFELDQAIAAFAPLKFAQVGQPKYDKLVGFVANNGKSASHYVIDKVECVVRRHEALFPYSISENPDVITAFGCSTVRGNSGAPLFAPGKVHVQAVLQGVSKSNRSVTATNVRCLGAPAKTCLAVEKGQNQARFHNMQLQAVEALKNRAPSRGHTAGIRYKASVFQLVNPPGSGDLRFEIFYQPLCREQDVRPPRIFVPIEQVTLTFNEWGELTTESLEPRSARFELGRVHGESVEVRTEWPAPFGELLNAGQHPRRTWGRSFSIDLPRCPR